MGAKKREKRSISRWLLAAAAYLCFVAQLALIIRGDIDYGILFAGLYFCLVIVFFVLWREELAHRILTLQSSLDDAVRRESQEHTKKEREQVKRLRKEKEELTLEREQDQRRLEQLSQENGTLAKQLKEAEQRKRETAMLEEAESILPAHENPAELDLVAVLARVMAKMEDVCRKAGVRLRLSCPNEALACRADERYIRLITENIIDNSIKYMRRSGSLVITLSHVGSSIFLAFKDDGMGMPPKEAEHIFDLNFQGSNRIGGSGLGLAQVKAAVRRLGGSVSARSADGMGIYIQLPVSGKAGDIDRGTEAEITEETDSGGRGKDEDTAGGE